MALKSNQLTPNLTQLTKFGLMNAYLVREDDGFTLVDTTMGAARDLIAAATDAGAQIRRIAVTHGHGDHVGSVDQLREKLGPDVPFLVPEVDVQILAGDRSAVPGVQRGSWPKLKTSPDQLLQAGDRVGSLEVLATPGHTPGHIAFRDVRDNSLIIGDTFHSIGGLTVPSYFSLPFPLPWVGTCDRAQVLESAKSLAALEPSLAVVGHGPAVRDPQAAMAKAIATADQKA